MIIKYPEDTLISRETVNRIKIDSVMTNNENYLIMYRLLNIATLSLCVNSASAVVYLGIKKISLITDYTPRMRDECNYSTNMIVWTSVKSATGYHGNMIRARAA